MNIYETYAVADYRLKFGLSNTNTIHTGYTAFDSVVYKLHDYNTSLEEDVCDISNFIGSEYYIKIWGLSNAQSDAIWFE